MDEEAFTDRPEYLRFQYVDCIVLIAMVLYIRQYCNYQLVSLNPVRHRKSRYPTWLRTKWMVKLHCTYI